MLQLRLREERLKEERHQFLGLTVFFSFCRSCWGGSSVSAGAERSGSSCSEVSHAPVPISFEDVKSNCIFCIDYLFFPFFCRSVFIL